MRDVLYALFLLAFTAGVVIQDRPFQRWKKKPEYTDSNDEYEPFVIQNIKAGLWGLAWASPVIIAIIILG